MSDGGAGNLSASIEQLMKAFPDAIDNAVKSTALTVQNHARVSIQREQSAGVVYQRGGVTHQASAPGDAPNTDTGALVSSIIAEYPRKGVAFVGTSKAYGAYLEFGTRNMAARPWLRPAKAQGQQELPKAITNAINKEIQRVSKK